VSNAIRKLERAVGHTRCVAETVCMASVWYWELRTQFKNKVACLRVYAFVGAGARPNLSATAEAEYVSCLDRLGCVATAPARCIGQDRCGPGRGG
jgi:hypothetical protein